MAAGGSVLPVLPVAVGFIKRRRPSVMFPWRCKCASAWCSAWCSARCSARCSALSTPQRSASRQCLLYLKGPLLLGCVPVNPSPGACNYPPLPPEQGEGGRGREAGEPLQKKKKPPAPPPSNPKQHVHKNERKRKTELNRPIKD